MSSYFGQGGSFRAPKTREDVDPMSSLSNVGDIMLVFACGLMVALVVAWNVDLGQIKQVEMNKELQKDDIEQITEQLYGEGNAFVNKGRVYQDPTTGKYYLVEDEETQGGSDGSSEDASGGSSDANNGQGQ